MPWNHRPLRWKQRPLSVFSQLKSRNLPENDRQELQFVWVDIYNPLMRKILSITFILALLSGGVLPAVAASEKPAKVS
jgi:hypothetical protein